MQAQWTQQMRRAAARLRSTSTRHCAAAITGFHCRSLTLLPLLLLLISVFVSVRAHGDDHQHEHEEDDEGTNMTTA